MEDILKRALLELGCSQREVKFYLATLQLGPAPIAAIARKAKLSRSTAYILADQLIERKLVDQDYKQYQKSLSAVSPKIVLRQLEAKRRRIGRSSLALESNLPAIESLYSGGLVAPDVKTYHGPSAIVAIQNDIMRARDNVVLWSNQQSERQFFSSSQRDTFIGERVNRGVPIRVLAVDNAEGRQLKTGDEANLRQTRLLDKSVSFTPETYIYDDKIAIIDYDQAVFAVTITNTLIAQSQRAIFEQAWSSLD